MKKLFVTALVLTALLAVTVGTAFAGSALELYQVQNNRGGVTFTFRVVGEFSQSELESGFVQVQGGDDYPLYCAQTAADTVVCHTSKKTGGHDVAVGFGGARFWTNVPEPAPLREICSSVYDWSRPANHEWQEYGSVCQEDAPLDGQQIKFYTVPFGTSTYSYYSFGSTDGEGVEIWASAGPGYYYP